MKLLLTQTKYSQNMRDTEFFGQFYTYI